jgi:simple sugar transport system substrate-binding protein
MGIGRAIEEAGMQGKVCLVGTGLPNPSAQYLESGAITAIGCGAPTRRTASYPRTLCLRANS